MFEKQEAQRATYRAPEYNLSPVLFTDWPEKYDIGRRR